VARANPSSEQSDQLDAIRRLASVLGAHLLVEQGDDVALVVQRVARERNITYILMGAPAERGALARLLRPSLAARLLRVLPEIDMRIVADRTRAVEREIPEMDQ
jgi:two-component system sensor histidine kinase KdpD